MLTLAQNCFWNFFLKTISEYPYSMITINARLIKKTWEQEKSSRNYSYRTNNSKFSLSFPHCVVFYSWSQKVDQLDEDSSYDSDTEAVNSPHPNASRNVSETLAQELEDFSSVSILFFIPSSSIPDLKQNIEIVVVSFFLFSLRTLYVVFRIASRTTDSIWSLLWSWDIPSDWCNLHWGVWAAILTTMSCWPSL